MASNITFNWIEMVNFMSVGSAPVRIDLNTNKLTSITGVNGTGKTTMIEALLYCLFNKPLRTVSLGLLVNSVNRKNMLTKVNFTIGPDNYEVHRGQKKAVFIIHKNGIALDQDASSRDLQAKLEEIIGCNYKTFTQVVVMSSMRYSAFMDLGAADRRVIVEKMLDIEVISKMAALLKDRVKISESAANQFDSKITEVQAKIAGLQRTIDSVNSIGDDQIIMIDGEIASIETNISNLQRDLRDMGVRMKELKSKEPEVPSGLEDQKTNNQIMTQNNREKRAGLKSQQTHLMTKAGEAKRTIEFYQQHDQCEVCRQKIETSFRHKMIEDSRVVYQSLGAEYKQNNAVIAECDAEIERLGAEFVELGKAAREHMEWESKCSRMLEDGRRIQGQIQNLMSSKSHATERKNALISKSNQDVAEFINDLDGLQDSLDELISNKSKASETVELCRLCGLMLKDNGLKARIVSQYIPVINKLLNDNLDILGANYSFTLDENFNEKILSRYRDEFVYSSFSNGEQSRINLAIVMMWRQLAMSKNTVSTNILFMDEILDGALDPDGIQNTLSLIKQQSGSVFVVTHRTEILDHFDMNISVRKDGNFSVYDFE